MDNPWLRLPEKPPFVLPEDEELVFKFNERRKEQNQIPVELPPEPYAGRKDAPVVLLTRHPSYHPLDHIYMCDNADFAASMQRTRALEKQDYPFYHLNKKYRGNPGLEFWEERLEQPLDELGHRTCSQGFLLLQLFPYKTNAQTKDKIFPSFEFTRTLLLDAIKRNAIVIPMYGKKEWEYYVSKLSSYEKYFTFDDKYKRKPIINQKLFPNGKYEQIIAAISENTPPE